MKKDIESNIEKIQKMEQGVNVIKNTGTFLEDLNYCSENVLNMTFFEPFCG